jgi:Zn-finger nucleic acid-binding protein
VSAGRCPRCAEPLAPRDLQGVTLQSCIKCAGNLVASRELTRVLESMSAHLLKSFDPDVEIQARKNTARAIDCPACAGAMSRDDYCAAGVVSFDRCDACDQLWLDPDELGTMALMWARMDSRIARQKARDEQDLRDADLLTGSLRLRRAVSSIIFDLLP